MRGWLRGSVTGCPGSAWALRRCEEQGPGRAWAMGTGMGFSSNGARAARATSGDEGLRLVMDG